ncbi:MAG TPA: hypothetical protein VKB60_04605, partial [Terriglobales bacterium]|nr:hypothetical protein [Terriglobales bacterium]
GIANFPRRPCQGVQKFAAGDVPCRQILKNAAFATSFGQQRAAFGNPISQFPGYQYILNSRTPQRNRSIVQSHKLRLPGDPELAACLDDEGESCVVLTRRSCKLQNLRLVWAGITDHLTAKAMPPPVMLWLIVMALSAHALTA